MALKKQQSMLETFSMASMTDVVFLLLVFFMVTSTYIFPTGMEVNLPQSNEQTTVKPATHILVKADGSMAGWYGDGEQQVFEKEEDLVNFIKQTAAADTISAIMLHGDASVSYDKIIKVLNVGARNNMRMVLATVPEGSASTSANTADSQSDDNNQSNS